MTNTPRPISKSSVGKTDDTVIPPDLEYAGALRSLVEAARGLEIKIPLANFYSEVPIELHDHVDTITYRFIKEESISMLAYLVSTHSGGVYAEVRFDGTVLQSWSEGSPLPQDAETRVRRAARIRFTLGV